VPSRNFRGVNYRKRFRGEVKCCDTPKKICGVRFSLSHCHSSGQGRSTTTPTRPSGQRPRPGGRGAATKTLETVALGQTCSHPNLGQQKPRAFRPRRPATNNFIRRSAFASCVVHAIRSYRDRREKWKCRWNWCAGVSAVTPFTLPKTVSFSARITPADHNGSPGHRGRKRTRQNEPGVGGSVAKFVWSLAYANAKTEPPVFRSN